MIVIPRVLLAALLVFGLWLSLQPSLSLSPWTPHGLLRGLGVPYDWVLAYEHALPYLLHVLVGAALLALIHWSALFGRSGGWASKSWSVFLVLGLAVTAESVQYAVGRGFEIVDIICTATGMLMVIFALRKR